MKTQPLCRRTVLRGAGGAAIGLPFLEAMLPRRARAQTGAKRLLVYFTPLGVSRPNWFPTGTETSFSIPPNLKPLEPHRDNLVVFKGLWHKAGLVKGGAPGGSSGNGHSVGTVTILTGRKAGPAGPNSNSATGISIDQEIAGRLQANTAYRSLQFGVLARTPYNGDVPATEWISFAAGGTPMPPVSDPITMFDRVFKNVQGGVDTTLLRRQQMRKGVVDFVKAEATSLQSRLGSVDRARLDQHLTGIADLERRLSMEVSSGGASCAPLRPNTPKIELYPDGTIAQSASVGNNYPVIGRAQIDLVVQAFACDLTRVASITWGGGAEIWTYSWLQGLVNRFNHHDMTHTPGNQMEADLAAMKTWSMTQLADLVTKLKAVPEGTGTVFDNTIILVVTEIDFIFDHAHEDMPWLILAGKNTGIRGNRFLDLKRLKMTNDLHASLLNAFGFAGNTFGDPAFGSGSPIPGLVG